MSAVSSADRPAATRMSLTICGSVFPLIRTLGTAGRAATRAAPSSSAWRPGLPVWRRVPSMSQRMSLCIASMIAHDVVVVPRRCDTYQRASDHSSTDR